MSFERITFEGHNGEDLAARLDLPEGPHLGTAIFAHCFTCSKDLPATRRIAGKLADMGIAVLRFDFTGLGQSKGDFSDTNFTTNVQDLLKAKDYLVGRKMTPNVLIGHSLGGAAVLAVAHQIPSVKAVVSLCAPFDPAHVTHNFAGAIEEINTIGSAKVSLGGRPFRIGKQFVEDVTRGQVDRRHQSIKCRLAGDASTQRHAGGH